MTTETAAVARGRATVEAHGLDYDMSVSVLAPGLTVLGHWMTGTVSPASTDRVLVLLRDGGVVDRIPWSAIWLIRTRGKAS